EYMRKLEAGGFTRQQAESQADALRQVLERHAATERDNIATKGDVNDDGRIILNDYLMSKRIEAGTKTADIDMLARADINGDGKINKADYDQIKKHILGD
ncbi:MAG: hypothetical protein IKV01_05230, partial [Clostridia bacterium]|nr:hypothetical protein [Clostridia bacterium]